MTRVIYCKGSYKQEGTTLKKLILQITLLLIAFGLIFLNMVNTVIASETSETNITFVSENSRWTLQIFTPNETTALSLDDLAAMPKTIVQAELSCYGEFIASGEWGGVKLGVLLENVGYNEPTAELQFYASDGYTTTFSFSESTSDDVIIAYEFGGGGLAEKLRLVIPGANGEAWIALITKISIIADPTYTRSPNPQAASIGPDQAATPQPAITPKPSPSPELRNQSTPMPTDPQPANKQVQQQDSQNSSSKIDFSHLIPTGIVIATTVTAGCLLYRNSKKWKSSK